MAVEWTRQSGETIEDLVAVLLCRRFPTAMLIRPSKGDGGIDVLVPLESGELEIYQVKKFFSNLRSSQKGQITKSFNRLEKYREETSLDVRAWHLTLPLNPTKENLTWLKGVTRNAAYPCDWRGLNFVDGLAAEFPDVIDYYLHDGADRLATAIAQMTNAMDLLGPRSQPPARHGLRTDRPRWTSSGGGLRPSLVRRRRGGRPARGAAADHPARRPVLAMHTVWTATPGTRDLGTQDVQRRGTPRGPRRAGDRGAGR